VPVSHEPPGGARPGRRAPVGRRRRRAKQVSRASLRRDGAWRVHLKCPQTMVYHPGRPPKRPVRDSVLPRNSRSRRRMNHQRHLSHQRPRANQPHRLNRANQLRRANRSNRRSRLNQNRLSSNRRRRLNRLLLSNQRLPSNRHPRSSRSNRRFPLNRHPRLNPFRLKNHQPPRLNRLCR
jgi:hypothetical protein